MCFCVLCICCCALGGEGMCFCVLAERGQPEMTSATEWNDEEDT